MDQDQDTRRPGETALAQGRTLKSRRVGALPILDRFLDRLRIEAILRDHLPREDRRWRVSTATVLLLLLPRTCSSRASPSTASASGPRGTTPRCSG